MIRRSTLFWLIAAILISCGLYQLKYEVQAKEERLARLNRQIQLEQEAIHVLHAEWAFLNRPDRLADLANRHLELAPVAPAQFGKVAGIPERPLHAVVAEAEVATPAAPPVKATSAPVKPAVKVQPATKLQVAEAKHSLGTIDLAQLRASAPAKPAGRDVVVIVDGTLLAHAQH